MPARVSLSLVGNRPKQALPFQPVGRKHRVQINGIIADCHAFKDFVRHNERQGQGNGTIYDEIGGMDIAGEPKGFACNLYLRASVKDPVAKGKPVIAGEIRIHIDRRLIAGQRYLWKPGGSKQLVISGQGDQARRISIGKIVQKDIPVFRFGQAFQRLQDRVHGKARCVILCGRDMPDLHFKQASKRIGKTGGGELFLYDGRVVRAGKGVIEDMLLGIPVNQRDCHPCAKAAERSQNQQRADGKGVGTVDYVFLQLTEGEGMQLFFPAGAACQQPQERAEAEKEQESAQKAGQQASDFLPCDASAEYHKGGQLDQGEPNGCPQDCRQGNAQAVVRTLTVDERFSTGLRFISASNEPSIHACMDIWRLPRGVLCASGTCFAPTEAERRPNTPLLCSAASLIPRCLQRGL